MGFVINLRIVQSSLHLSQNGRNVTCTIGKKHGHQSAILKVIYMQITNDLHFDLYLPCTKHEVDRIKTEAVIARQRKYYAQKMTKIRIGI